jgi:hypothetical protein
MCTVVLLVRPGHDWPVMVAANRDERIDRAWDAPAAFWPDRPGVVAGRDRTGGGTWMGLNRHGVVATVLNRQGTLGPAAGKRSRGELPLMALAQPTAAAAVAAMEALDAGEWRGFNMVIADAHGGYFLRGLGRGHPETLPLGPGIHMVTAHEPNDPDSPRVARHLARFQASAPPEPGAWDGWRAILADRSGPEGTEINIPPRGGFGTVSSSLLALGARGEAEWDFAAGPPHAVAYGRVAAPQ